MSDAPRAELVASTQRSLPVLALSQGNEGRVVPTRTEPPRHRLQLPGRVHPAFSARLPRRKPRCSRVFRARVCHRCPVWPSIRKSCQSILSRFNTLCGAGKFLCTPRPGRLIGLSSVAFNIEPPHCSTSIYKKNRTGMTEASRHDPGATEIAVRRFTVSVLNFMEGRGSRSAWPVSSSPNWRHKKNARVSGIVIRSFGTRPYWIGFHEIEVVREGVSVSGSASPTMSILLNCAELLPSTDTAVQSSSRTSTPLSPAWAMTFKDRIIPLRSLGPRPAAPLPGIGGSRCCVRPTPCPMYSRFTE